MGNNQSRGNNHGNSGAGSSASSSPAGSLPASATTTTTGSGGGDKAQSSRGSHHGSHSHTHSQSRRHHPQRKDSLNAVPIKASATTSTTNEHDLIMHGDLLVPISNRGPATAEKLLGDLNLSASAASDSPSPPKPTEATATDIPGATGRTRGTDRKPGSTKILADPALEVESPLPTGAGVLAPGSLPRRSSFGSATTVDTADEDAGVDDSRLIPTAIMWPHEGRKVYVTGTFSGWKKKFKLSASDNHLSTVVPLPPGTHHIKFLVDGHMRTSDAMPTAVDATGVLVNYIEVLPDELPPLNRQPSVVRSASRIDSLPVAAAGPPSVDGSRVAGGSVHGVSSITGQSTVNDSFGGPFSQKPAKRYTTAIPAFLDELEEMQERYGRSFDSQLPPPPTLPMILSKVILNGSTANRDDSSVLGIPNHVVLNHLATSSIKNHVLAISATTRYKRKYVTTILYKSTSAS